MNEIKIVVTQNSKQNIIAAEEFKKYYALVTGKEIEITNRDGDYDIVAIGNETNNDYIQKLYFDKKIPRFPLRYGEENFLIRTQKIDGKNVLFLTGGRPRATLYATYHYFERFLGVRYFWDGERIPKRAEIPMEGLDIFEAPRFKYRGQRYFSHRSLHRFQAEHWSLEDWKKEIDWMLKKKLNLAALFIGLDDLFQRAFPNEVGYESVEKEDFGSGYENRKSFWPLKYRGELRKQLLDYLHDRDLISLENCGTLTHWNTKSPQEFLDAYKPSFFKQTANSGYSDERALVWDIREQRNFDLYFQLTKTLVNEYSKPGDFYTIGFAERLFSDDAEENMRMKLFCYHKLIERLQLEYPNHKLMLCGWDLWFKFKTHEVKELADSLNPDQTIIMDYNSDSYCKHNLTKWGIINKYPHTFGIFHAYEMNNDIRGDYTLTHKRMKSVIKDKQCQGFVFWPELSHSDTFMLEYYPQNAWAPRKLTLKQHVQKFCEDRYVEGKEKMYDIWTRFFPIVQLMHWNMDQTRPAIMPIEYFFNINWRYKIETIDFYDEKLPRFLSLRKDVIALTEEIAPFLQTNDELLRRDCYDILKTLYGRYIHYTMALCKRYYAKAAKKNDFSIVFEMLEGCRAMIAKLGEFLGCRDEYTLQDSLQKLAAVHPIPDDFERVLKDNAYNGYCRSYIFELFKDMYLKEFDMFVKNLKKSVETGKKVAVDLAVEKVIFDGFLDKPLAEMQPQTKDTAKVVRELAALMRNMLIY